MAQYPGLFPVRNYRAVARWSHLDNGERLTVDHIILATGYKVEMNRVPFLVRGNILDELKTRNGYPVLDEHLQTNIPGLFFTSMAAAQDFGAFFAFTISVARIGETDGASHGKLRKCFSTEYLGQ